MRSDKLAHKGEMRFTLFAMENQQLGMSMAMIGPKSELASYKRKREAKLRLQQIERGDN